jgi:Ca2+-binding EF-hand superfamily protein
MDIFKTYDRDSSGFLDKLESKKLVKEMLTNLGLRVTLKDQEYDQIFEKFDKNGDGVIQKAEVKDLVYAITNLKNPSAKIIKKPLEIATKKSSQKSLNRSNTSMLRES